MISVTDSQRSSATLRGYFIRIWKNKRCFLKTTYFRCPLLTVLFFLVLDATVFNAAAQAPGMRVDGSDNQPWEELPDGRVVIEIKGNKIALDKDIDWDARYLTLRFASWTSSRFKEMSFQDVVEHPGIARNVFKSWDVVRIYTQNTRRSLGLFPGRYDRKLIPA
jgi:hypothetical protein